MATALASKFAARVIAKRLLEEGAISKLVRKLWLQEIVSSGNVCCRNALKRSRR